MQQFPRETSERMYTTTGLWEIGERSDRNVWQTVIRQLVSWVWRARGARARFRGRDESILRYTPKKFRLFDIWIDVLTNQIQRDLIVFARMAWSKGARHRDARATYPIRPSPLSKSETGAILTTMNMYAAECETAALTSDGRPVRP